VHRIGRTGRAGAEGEAVSLVCVDELKLLADIERKIKREIPASTVEGFNWDPKAKPEPIQNGRGPRQGNPRQDGARNPAGNKPRSNTGKPPAKKPQRPQASRERQEINGNVIPKAKPDVNGNAIPKTRPDANGNVAPPKAPARSPRPSGNTTAALLGGGPGRRSGGRHR